MNGGYWKNTTLYGGEQAMVKVQPPRAVLEADTKSEAETAQLVYKNLDAAQLAIMKKVLFNSESFTYFSWAKSKGLLG
jgi:hypothetical protein